MNAEQVQIHDFLDILIVEDDEGLRRLIRRHLRRNKYTVATASSGEEAIAAVTAKPDVLLLLDFRLQDITGREVIDRLKEKGFDVPFIIMTGNGDERIAVEMMKMGAKDYLVKDKNFLEIIPQVIEQVLTRLYTDKKLEGMEKALRESEYRFRMLFNSFTDAILVHEMKNMEPSNFFEANDIAYERLEYTREELFALKPSDIEAPENKDETNTIKESLMNHKHALYETVYISKSGRQIPVEINAHLIDLSGKPAVLSVSRDITERKLLEEQLRQSHKMEAIGKLAGGVAHDFNNLLTAIIGYSELMLVKMDTENPHRDGIKEIKKAGERAASLTQQLLAFSRKQMLKPKLLDMNTVVSGIEKMLKRIIGENISFISSLEPGLMQVKADPGQIEQILLNLSVNAGDAMQKGGKLTLKTANRIIDENYCNLNPESRPGKFVCLSITDTGEGMTKETLQHIFEPFFTTKKVGTGLGLSVVYGIIKQHNGWITVYSEVGDGTTFSILLPAIESETENVVEERVSLNDLKGNNEKILFVEDEEGVRKITIRSLCDYGYNVTAAETFEEAMDLFEKHAGDFDLVFSDIVLPDETGIELVEELLVLKPGIKVLLTSGYADKKSRWADVNERGLPFLQKPYSLMDLLKTIREVLTS
ncbi:MAG: MEKHLA domain-containing protein [bacterium]|nr:MEKHLA domain-containing protein [bacterium]